MQFTPADKVHFYSYQTKISLELMNGWEEEREEPDTAVYYVDLSEVPEDIDMPGTSPRILVRANATGTNTPGNHIKLADAVLASDLDNIEVINREEGVLDNQPSVFDTFTFDENGTRVLQYMAHAQYEDVVFSLICTVEEAYTDIFIDSMKAGVASVRFILLPTEGLDR